MSTYYGGKNMGAAFCSGDNVDPCNFKLVLSSQKPSNWGLRNAICNGKLIVTFKAIQSLHINILALWSFDWTEVKIPWSKCSTVRNIKSCVGHLSGKTASITYGLTVILQPTCMQSRAASLPHFVSEAHHPLIGFGFVCACWLWGCTPSKTSEFDVIYP